MHSLTPVIGHSTTQGKAGSEIRNSLYHTDNQ